MSVTLSGVITGEGSPLSGASLTVYDMTGANVGSTTTAGDGSYSFSLAAGVYKMYVDGTGEGMGAIWYGGEGTFGAGAELFLVSAAVTANVALYTAVTSRFSLNGITVRVWDYQGFDLPTFATVVPVLSDGTSTINQTIQTGSLPGRIASFGCTLRTWGDVQTLRGWNASKEQLTWVDTYGDTLTVVLLDLAVATIPGGLDPSAGLGTWSYTMTLAEVP